MFEAVLSGFALGLGLIVAIGAQNALVLRQGLMREHVVLVVTICALSDAILITAGVMGLGRVVEANPTLLKIVTIGGALFLIAYGCLALMRAVRGGTLQASEVTETNQKALALTCLALTWLNPHVYLDTVLLLGSLSAQFDGGAHVAFGAGAVTASFVWFIALGFGARLLAPIFARPLAWRLLDLAIAAVMFLIAAKLLLDSPMS